MNNLPIIYLKKKKETLAEKRAKLSAPLRVLTSLKTTAVLGAVLGSLVAPAASGRLALGALKGAGRFVTKRPLASILGAGALIASPKLRRDVASLPSKTLKAGEKLGEIYEEPSKAIDVLGIKEKMTVKEKVLAGLKVAGTGGALIAGGLVAKKYLAERKAKKASEQLKGLSTLGFTEPKPVGLGGMPVSAPIQPQLKPSSVPQSKKTGQPLYNVIQISVR